MTGTADAVDLRAEAVGVLTAAARRTDDDGSPRDFADFVAGVLTAAAANAGDIERLLAGRPGSWEASLVRSLVIGTVGDEPSDLLRERTEPIVVTLNVAEMLEGLDLHPGILTVAEALNACEERCEEIDDSECIELEEELNAIEDRYTREFASYVERFAVAVQAAAVVIGGAPVRTLVKADADPWSDWWTEGATVNPPLPAAEDCELILDLWDAAHDVVALPNVDLQPFARRAAAAEDVLSSREVAD